jgi:hypothetical protein
MRYERADKPPGVSILNRTAAIAYGSLVKYVREVNVTAAESDNCDRGKSQPKIPCDGKLTVKVGDNVKLEHAEWDMRDMPQAKSSASYAPRSKMHKGQDNRLYIRIDLPGFKASEWLADTDFPAPREKDKSQWFGVKENVHERTRRFIVEGHRQKPSWDDDGNDSGQPFGLFHLLFTVDDATFNSDPEVTFEDATLKIIIHHKKGRMGLPKTTEPPKTTELRL